MARRRTHVLVTSVIGVLGLALLALLGLRLLTDSVLRQLTDGTLEGADYWTSDPRILSAGLGFDGIIGLPDLDEQTVRDAGGSWYGGLRCSDGEDPTDQNRTSAATTATIERAYVGGADVDHDDGLPVVFSWPVATETVDPTDFAFTLNTGETVFAHAAGMNPNWEDDERNTVVLFGDLGNRLPSADPDAVFPVRLEIVADDTPLVLVGPGGREVSAVGLTWTTDSSPYDAGPVLVGAKLNRVGSAPVGEGGVDLLERAGAMPNDEFALYGGGDFRLRVLTSGGFSPDGVTGLRPDEFEEFFRLRGRGPGGDTVVLDQVGVDYRLAGGTLRVVGLADLGRREAEYDDCYQEDRDNYIDIILDGDEAAARSIEAVEIPALPGGYRAFYNPGGPGPEPFPGVRYTAPGPPDVQPVTLALDDPMRVTRARAANGPAGRILGLAAATLAVVLAVAVYWRRGWTRPRPERPPARTDRPPRAPRGA
ncbi:MAG: phospholipase [Nocardioides sp.]|nr:hypothetical protein [Nocardioidaceae bacterium]MCB8956221.1 phospholipase [Nocardioides sp.]